MRPSSATAAPRGSGFGARLREARNRAGLSQSELGKAIGKSKDAVSQWEREKMGISWETLRQVADVLDADEFWLRDGEALPVGPTGRPKAPSEPDFTIVRDGVEKILVEVKSSGAQLEAMQRRIARLESVVLVLLDEADWTTDDRDADALVAATRRAKALLAEDLDAEADAPASEAETGTRGEGDATTGAGRAPRAGTRRSASKRAR